MSAAPVQTGLSEQAGVAAGEAILDEAALASLRELDPGGADNLLSNIVLAYLSTAPKEIGVMEAALQRQDGAALRMAAHSMKSSSGYVGALKLRELCRELETCGHESRLDAAQPLYAQLRAEYERVESALRRLLADKHEPAQ